MSSQPEDERTELAIAFDAVVSRRLDELGHGSRSKLGQHLGHEGASARSLVTDLVHKRKGVPSERFADVAAYLGLRPSELLREMAQWLEENGL